MREASLTSGQLVKSAFIYGLSLTEHVAENTKLGIVLGRRD